MFGLFAWSNPTLFVFIHRTRCGIQQINNTSGSQAHRGGEKKLIIIIIMGMITGSERGVHLNLMNRYWLKKVNFEAGICRKSGVERNPVNPGGRRKWLQFCGSGQLSKTDCNPRYFPSMKCFLAKPHLSTSPLLSPPPSPSFNHSLLTKEYIIFC